MWPQQHPIGKKWKEGDKSTYKPKYEKEGKEWGSSKQVEAPKPKTSSIECFKCKERGHIQWDCPNKRAMIIVNGKYNSEDDEEDNEMPPLEDISNVEEDLKEVDYKDFLVVKRTLSTQTSRKRWTMWQHFPCKMSS